MRQKSVPEKEPSTQVVKNIRRATRRHFSAEGKIRIVLEGLRGKDSIAELSAHAAEELIAADHEPATTVGPLQKPTTHESQNN
jgi:transposase-like protein